MDKYAGGMGVISAGASRAMVRVMHTDEAQMSVCSMSRALGLGMSG